MKHSPHWEAEGEGRIKLIGIGILLEEENLLHDSSSKGGLRSTRAKVLRPKKYSSSTTRTGWPKTPTDGQGHQGRATERLTLDHPVTKKS